MRIDPGLHGTYQMGIFLSQPVKAAKIVIDYTGNRVWVEDIAKFDHARDRSGILSDRQVHIPSEGSVIGPEVVGNDAFYFNHSCEPNCQLQEVDVVGRMVVALVDVCDKLVYTELRCKYSYMSGLIEDPVKCYIRAAKFRGTVKRVQNLSISSSI